MPTEPIAGRPSPASLPGQPAETAASPVARSRASAGKSPDDDIRQIGLVYLSFLAIAVGVITGFGAVGFRDLIGIIHNGFFLGQLAVRYDANLFTPPSPWRAVVIL